MFPNGDANRAHAFERAAGKRIHKPVRRASPVAASDPHARCRDEGVAARKFLLAESSATWTKAALQSAGDLDCSESLCESSIAPNSASPTAGMRFPKSLATDSAERTRTTHF